MFMDETALLSGVSSDNPRIHFIVPLAKACTKFDCIDVHNLLLDSSDSFGLNSNGDVPLLREKDFIPLMREVFRFLILKVADGDLEDASLSPSPLILSTWRVLLWSTKEYRLLCHRLTRTHKILDHNSSFHVIGPARQQRYIHTLNLYRSFFGVTPPSHLWPPSDDIGSPERAPRRAAKSNAPSSKWNKVASMVTEEEELEDDIGPAESFAETVYSRLDGDEKDSFLHEMKRRKTEQDVYEIDDESEHNGKTDVALTPPAASPRFSLEISSDDAKAISITASTEITTVPPNFTTETTEEANSKLPNVVKQEFPKTKMIKLQIKSDIPRYEPFTFKIKYEVPFEESFKIYARHYGAELDRLVFVFDNKKISPTANAKSLQLKEGDFIQAYEELLITIESDLVETDNRVKISNPRALMEPIFKLYSEKNSLDFIGLTFTYMNQVIDSSATPHSLKLRQGDIIEARRKDAVVVLDEDNSFDYVRSLLENSRWSRYRDKVASICQKLQRLKTGKALLTQENEAELYISLRSCLLKIQSKNQDHIQHMQLGLDKSKAGVEQGDEVDLQDVMCSVCKRMDAEDNDIILCDKKGCCRAYHQNCLNPPITDTSKLGEHFFCWVCDTLTNCFEEINTMLGINVSSIEELFPSG